MPEYIKKETLIDILNSKSDMAVGTTKMVIASVVKMVDVLPALDAVEVVRCKDCVFCEQGRGACIHCKLHDCRFGKNGFCSYGERLVP